MFKIKKQLSKLYVTSVLGNLSLTGAWVAILVSRGYSLVEIGIAETVFHMVSIIFEIPSGVLADVFGRKKMLVVSTIMGMVSDVIMILSCNLFMVCLSIAFRALSYNFSSGTGDALAYDSLKQVHMEGKFEKYMSNQLMIYRLCSGISTLCAGIALTIGYRIAYGTSFITATIQIIILFSLHEIHVECQEQDIEKKIGEELIACLKESLRFLKEMRKCMGIMLCNSLVGVIDILLLFFLQGKLPESGISKWWLGFALLFMELGGIVGSRLILKMPKIKYKWIFVIALLLVVTGLLTEHSGICWIMILGGFLAAIGDDFLQVRTNVILQDMFPSQQRATLISIESFSFSLIMIVLSPLAGFFFTYW